MRGLSTREFEPRARALLASVGLADFVDRYPSELSGGMQQRTEFCRALIHDPPLILMDEPLGALDAMTREQLRGDLERIWMDKQKTVILVTHSIEEAVQLSDEVVIISPRPGRIRTADPGLPGKASHSRGPAIADLPKTGRRDQGHLPGIWRDLMGKAVPLAPPANWSGKGWLSASATPLLFGLALILLWEFASRFFAIPMCLLPAPSDISVQLVRRFPQILEYTLVTGMETFVGFILAIMFGVPMGLLVAFSPLLRRTFYPLAVSLEMVPKIVFAPVFISWWGLGFAPKIYVVILVCFFPVMLNGILAFSSLSVGLTRFCQTTGAGPLRTFLKVRLPAALPQLLVGIKGAAINATVGATVAEWIGSDAGLGFFIQQAVGQYRMDIAFAGIVMLAALGMLLFWLVAAAERVLIPWHVSVRSQRGTLSET